MLLMSSSTNAAAPDFVEKEQKKERTFLSNSYRLARRLTINIYENPRKTGWSTNKFQSRNKSWQNSNDLPLKCAIKKQNKKTKKQVRSRSDVPYLSRYYNNNLNYKQIDTVWLMTKFTTIFHQAAVHFPEWNFITSYVRNVFVFLSRLEKNKRIGTFPAHHSGSSGLFSNCSTTHS